MLTLADRLGGMWRDDPDETIRMSARRLASEAGVVIDDQDFAEGMDFMARLYALVADGEVDGPSTEDYRASFEELADTNPAGRAILVSEDDEELDRLRTRSAELILEHDRVRDWALSLERDVVAIREAAQAEHAALDARIRALESELAASEATHRGRRGRRSRG